MELRVFVVKDKASLEKLLREEWVKRLSPDVYEEDRVYLVVKTDEEGVRKLLSSGVLELPEDEEELKRKFEELERRRYSAGILFS